MASVTVQEVSSTDGWRFVVAVSDGGRETRHEVTLDPTAYERLTGGQASAETLVRESFAFLLEHESAGSILRSFDLPVIGRYFPAYEAEVRRRLGLP